MMVGAVESADYLRGYLDALLDTRFAGLRMQVRTLAPDGSVTLSTATCLGPSQKRDVTRLLVETGQVTAVVWDEPSDCPGRPRPVAPPVAEEQPPDPEGWRVDIRLLPEGELFAPLTADPRQPRFSVSYQRYRTPMQTFSAANVAFGEYFGLATGFLGTSGSSQIGIQGGVFALFNLDAPSHDLVNADYWIGLPLSYRKGPWSYVVRVYHQSSHLGDEFILGNPGVDRVNLSYEDLEALVSYEWERWRVYGGGGYLYYDVRSLGRSADTDRPLVGHLEPGRRSERHRSEGHSLRCVAPRPCRSPRLRGAFLQQRRLGRHRRGCRLGRRSRLRRGR